MLKVIILQSRTEDLLQEYINNFIKKMGPTLNISSIKFIPFYDPDIETTKFFAFIQYTV